MSMRIFFFIFFLLFTPSGLLKNVFGQTIEMVFIESPPFYFTNPAGKPEGILIDIVDKVMKKAGYDWHAEAFPVKRMARMMADGRAHLWVGIPNLPEFEGTTYVGESEIFKVTLYSFRTGNSPPVLKKEDLAGKSLIVLRGYSYGGWINFIKDPSNNVKHEEPDTHESAFAMLKAGRADYLLAYKEPAERILKKTDIPDLKQNEISSNILRFVVSRKTPNAKEVLDKLENAYQQLKAEGVLKIEERK